jgi:mono/diheme cytochrome c family protein
MRVLLALAACLAALALGGCGGGDDEGAATTASTLPAATGGATDTGAAADGASVFASAGCGSCHTLKAAGSSGSVGPNLDELQPSKDRVAQQVRNGGGGMPAFGDQLSDAEIDAVAEYVASSAGG